MREKTGSGDRDLRGAGLTSKLTAKRVFYLPIQPAAIYIVAVRTVAGQEKSWYNPTLPLESGSFAQ